MRKWSWVCMSLAHFYLVSWISRWLWTKADGKFISLDFSPNVRPKISHAGRFYLNVFMHSAYNILNSLFCYIYIIAYFLKIQLISFRKMWRQNTPSCFTSQSCTNYFKEEVIIIFVVLVSHHCIPVVCLYLSVFLLVCNFEFWQLESQISDGLGSKETIMFSLWIYWGPVLKTCLTFVAGSCL